MSRRLTAADEWLRRVLLAPPARVLSLLLSVCAAACFALFMLTRTMGQLAGAGMGARLACVLMLCAPLAVMLYFARRTAQENGYGLSGHVLMAGVCAVAMLARVSFLDHVSSDYDVYLSDWLAKFGAVSFREGMRQNIGEYNVLYQYILFLITRLPVPPLYAVKAVTFIGDAFLAGAAARLAGKGRRGSAMALCLVLMLPTCVIDGGMFAQCDSLYAACALWGLAHALSGKPARSAVCFALSLAFKLQAVFLLPIVAVLWSARKLRLADALVFIAALVAAALPALLGGKSVAQILSIYIGQTGLYNGLTYNAASFFGLMNTAGLDPYAYGNFGMALALCAVMALLAAYIPRVKTMTDMDWVCASLQMVLLVVFLLPRMHERYFYMADVLAVTFGVKNRRAVIPAALITLASLSTYWDLGLPLNIASLMMLTAIVLLLKQGKWTCTDENVGI